MEPIEYDAFWSYTHEDNARSQNSILNFATMLQDEFAISTGDDLGMFVDRREIRWGEQWRLRITDAIGQAPFFIPIITPKFVRSEECRKEFIAFSSAAKSRGLDKLLLPILYIPVPGLRDDSDDELLALIARTQYVDWTGFRLKSPDHPDVRQAVNDLALRLHGLRQEVRESTLIEETKTAEQTTADLANTISEITSRFDAWMESVDFDKIAGVTWGSTRDARLARAGRLRDSHAAQSAIFSTFVQMGKELLPISENRLEKAKNYARLTIELDPLVRTAIRLVSMHQEESPELDFLRDGMNEAYLNIEPPDGRHNDYGIPAHLVDLNKHLAESDRNIVESYAFVKEGNEIVLAWRELLLKLDGPPVLALRRDSD